MYCIIFKETKLKKERENYRDQSKLTQRKPDPDPVFDIFFHTERVRGVVRDQRDQRKRRPSGAERPLVVGIILPAGRIIEVLGRSYASVHIVLNIH